VLGALGPMGNRRRYGNIGYYLHSLQIFGIVIIRDRSDWINVNVLHNDTQKALKPITNAHRKNVTAIDAMIVKVSYDSRAVCFLRPGKYKFYYNNSF